MTITYYEVEECATYLPIIISCLPDHIRPDPSSELSHGLVPFPTWTSIDHDPLQVGNTPVAGSSAELGLSDITLQRNKELSTYATFQFEKGLKRIDALIEKKKKKKADRVYFVQEW